MYIPDNIAGYRILLCSTSPRRRELLQMLDIPFAIADPVEVDELYPVTLPARDVPRYLAQLKADAYLPHIADTDLIITADTVVIVDDDILGKPRDEAEAIRMLRTLSGRTHTVVTGVCVATRDRKRTFSAATDVQFSDIPETEIRSYVERYHPLDKAGAYGIQEWIGAVGIRDIHGSFYNVMGLPVHRLWECLKTF